MKIFINPFELQWTKPIDIGVPAARNIFVFHEKIIILIVNIDERFNTIDIKQSLRPYFEKQDNQIRKLIYDYYYELKNSDPGYGNDSNGYFFEHTKTIFVEDFINYLKLKNREHIIDELI